MVRCPRLCQNGDKEDFISVYVEPLPSFFIGLVHTAMIYLLTEIRKLGGHVFVSPLHGINKFLIVELIGYAMMLLDK